MGNQSSNVEFANQHSEKEEKIAQDDEKYYERIFNVIDNDDDAKLHRMVKAKLDTMNSKQCGVNDERAVFKLKEIHSDYWSLLLKTSIKVGVLTKKCKMERENVQDLIEIIHYSKSNVIGEFELGKCIKTEVIKDLMYDWAKMNQRLKDTIGEWQELKKAVAANKKKKTKKRIVTVVGGIAITILAIPAIVLTAGIAGVVIGGGVAAAAAAGGAGTAGAARAGAGGARAMKNAKISNTIINQLNVMFTTGMAMMETLTHFQNVCEEAEDRLTHFKHIYKRGERRLTHFKHDCEGTEIEHMVRRDELTLTSELKRIDCDLNQVIDICNNQIKVPITRQFTLLVFN